MNKQTKEVFDWIGDHLFSIAEREEFTAEQLAKLTENMLIEKILEKVDFYEIAETVLENLDMEEE